MIQFKPAKHTLNELDIIEIWKDGKFIAAIYPQPDGIKICSKHVKRVIRLNPIELVIMIEDFKNVK